MASSTCAAVRRKDGGSQSSNWRLYLRTASMPLFSRSRSMRETAAAVSWSCSKRRCCPSFRICMALFQAHEGDGVAVDEGVDDFLRHLRQARISGDTVHVPQARDGVAGCGERVVRAE